MQQATFATIGGDSTDEIRSRSSGGRRGAGSEPGSHGHEGSGSDGDARSRNRHSESQSRDTKTRPPWGTYGAPWIVTAVTCPVHGFTAARLVGAVDTQG